MKPEEQCVACIVQKCQFSDFLKGKKYYVKDEKGDCYCLFHAPKELKNKFTYAQNELFLKTIDEYIDSMMKQAHTVNFSNVIFHLPIVVSNKNASTDEYRGESNIKIDFSNAVFYEYVDIRNIKCKELVFEDTKFLKGGALKNRGGTNNLYIEYLIVRPFVVESDFVIDIGGYAKEDGKIEVDGYGTIKNIKFENHKEGKGIVYFVGLNQYVEKADFRNRNLDLVSFQNCDLSKCYFLNAKVDKTEFRNCVFPLRADQNEKLVFSLMFLGSIFGIVAIIINRGIGAILFATCMILLFIYLINLVTRKHKSIVDTHTTKKDIEVLAIIEIYKSLQRNNSFSFQEKGDFFYAMRTNQLRLKQFSKDKMIYRIHSLINGFGEKYWIALIMFVFVIFWFSILYIPDKDFQATPQTPQIFFCSNKKEKDSNNTVISYNNIPYRIYWTKEGNNTYESHTLLVGQMLDFNETSNEINLKRIGCQFGISLTYSLSRFISPLTKNSQAWFKTISSKAIILSTIETILLYLFFGAFILALKNRIKR